MLPLSLDGLREDFIVSRISELMLRAELSGFRIKKKHYLQVVAVFSGSWLKDEGSRAYLKFLLKDGAKTVRSKQGKKENVQN